MSAANEETLVRECNQLSDRINDDLIKLQDDAFERGYQRGQESTPGPDMLGALEARCAGLERALRKITSYHPGATYDMDDYVYDLKDIARAALADTATDEVQP